MTSTVGRTAPVVAGAAGLAWIWAELAPQREGFADTDDPALGLQFLAAFPGSHAVAGLWLLVASLALIATVLVAATRLRARALEQNHGAEPLGASYLRVIGLLAAAMLFGMAVVRLGEGPVRYVQGLDQGWGETAYLITQFVGVQVFAAGGLVLLALWIAGMAVLGARWSLLPRPLAVLAILPAVRLVGVMGPLGLEVDGLWFVMMAAIPAAFIWLILFGLSLSPRARGAVSQVEPSPVPL